MEFYEIIQIHDEHGILMYMCVYYACILCIVFIFFKKVWGKVKEQVN